jgi:hypothetical protein
MVSALFENDNKCLCFVVLKFFFLSVENPEFCLVLLHQSWSSVFAPWYPWFGEGLLYAVLANILISLPYYTPTKSAIASVVRRYIPAWSFGVLNL